MKTTLAEITGCSGSQKFRAVAEYSKVGPARAEAKRLNTELADNLGICGRKARALIESWEEGNYVAIKAPFDEVNGSFITRRF